MQYISRILIVLAVLVFAQNANAQPPTRRGGNNTEKKEKAANIKLTERAKAQYPDVTVSEEVDWKREIYRSINLEVEENATLYYPVEPMGESVNLFTLLFRLVLSGDITAYKYNLDGYESFTEENKLEPKTMLENYSVYYEENNGELIVGNSDVPSAEVLSYYVKESHYYDQRRGVYGKQITAVCPVIHRAGEYSAEITKYPMFWVRYSDIKPYLAQNKVMTSSLNNVAQTTFDDFFAKGMYKGDIYKTVNAKNLAISQYCKDSIEIKKEQDKIEQQLKDFEANLWSTKTVAEMRQDSIKAANDTIKTDKKEKAVEKSKAVRTTTASKSQKSVSKKSSTSKPREQATSRSNSGTVSVRRTRR